MEFNSYKYYQYEVALAKLIQLIIDRSKEIEQFKLSYVSHMKFDSYEVFLTVDEDKVKYISTPDLMKFLRRNQISVKQNEIEFLLERYASMSKLMFFKDFLRLILPLGDEDMIDTVVKQSLGVVKDSSKRISPLIEDKIAGLILQEVQMIRDVEELKIMIASRHQWSFKLASEVVMKGREGHVTSKIIDGFMQTNGKGKYQNSDYKFLKFRFSKNEGLDSLTVQEFSDMVYPYEFFYDKEDPKYDNFKSQQQEIEGEKVVQKKIKEKEEFDSKFKIIGDFIKDPEYFEHPPNIIEFFEKNQYRELYKNLKNFDFYIQFAKEKIAFKTEKVEEKGEILDFYQTIKQHQRDLKKFEGRKSKKSKSMITPTFNTYKGLEGMGIGGSGNNEEEEDLFDTSNMPKLKDYKRQLNYETPNKPKTIKDLVRSIRNDRNMYYYEDPEMKILNRMNLFSKIREDLKKNEIREQVLENKIEVIKQNDEHTKMMEKRKLFSAFSRYDMIEDVDFTSPKQSSPYKTYLFQNNQKDQNDPLTFRDALAAEVSGNKQDDKLIKPVSAAQNQEHSDNVSAASPVSFSKRLKQQRQKQNVTLNVQEIQEKANQKTPISQKSGGSQFFKSKPSLPLISQISPINHQVKSQKRVIISDKAEVKLLHFNEDGEAYPSHNISQQSIDQIDHFNAFFPKNKSDQTLTDTLQKVESPRFHQEQEDHKKTVPKPKQKKPPQKQVCITDKAFKDVIQFKLINAVRRQRMMQMIVDKNSLGDYNNKGVYKKYYQ